MSKVWNELTPDHQIHALRTELDEALKTITAMQNDLTGLMRRFVELEAQQNSTYSLVNEVVTSIEKV